MKSRGFLHFPRPAPDILWNLFISFSPPHTKSFYISTFLHLKSSWSRCFFFAKIYDIGKVPTKCRPFGRCFGVNLFEIFCENLRYFEISTNGRKYCRCRMGDHQVRVFAHHCLQPWLCGSVNHTASRNKHHGEETTPLFCCSARLCWSMHRPGYVQGGQEVGRDYLLLRIHVRRIRSLYSSGELVARPADEVPASG